MSVLPPQALQKLSPYQTAALDQRYSQATGLLPGIAAKPASAGDSLFISLDAEVALQQFEQAKGSSVDDSPQAALVQSLTSPTAGQAPSFTSMATQVALVQYQYDARKRTDA